MRVSLFSISLLSLAVVSLSACTTLPTSNELTRGIPQSAMSKSQSPSQAPVTLRANTDPVCVNFYNNVRAYNVKASQPNQGTNFLAAVGVGVLSSVAGGGIATAGLGQVGQVAAQTATNQALTIGSQSTIRSLSQSSKADVKIIKVAQDLSCPISIAP